MLRTFKPPGATQRPMPHRSPRLHPHTSPIRRGTLARRRPADPPPRSGKPEPARAPAPCWYRSTSSPSALYVQVPSRLADLACAQPARGVPPPAGGSDPFSAGRQKLLTPPADSCRHQATLARQHPTPRRPGAQDHPLLATRARVPPDLTATVPAAAPHPLSLPSIPASMPPDVNDLHPFHPESRGTGCAPFRQATRVLIPQMCLYPYLSKIWPRISVHYAAVSQRATPTISGRCAPRVLALPTTGRTGSARRHPNRNIRLRLTCEPTLRKRPRGRPGLRLSHLPPPAARRAYVLSFARLDNRSW